MYKNVIINKKYGILTNEVIENIPSLYRNFKRYKIEKMVVTFQPDQSIYYINNNDINIKSDWRKRINENDNLFDVLQYQIIDVKDIPLKSKICYCTSNGMNNAVILDTNIHFDMVCCGLVENNKECSLESDWMKGVDKIYFAFYNENFFKLAIDEIYLNIKLSYEDADSEYKR